MKKAGRSPKNTLGIEAISPLPTVLIKICTADSLKKGLFEKWLKIKKRKNVLIFPLFIFYHSGTKNKSSINEDQHVLTFSLILLFTTHCPINGANLCHNLLVTHHQTTKF